MAIILRFKNFYYIFLFPFLFLSIPVNIYAQEPIQTELEQTIEEKLENLTETIEDLTETSADDIDFTGIIEILEQLQRNPLNINTASFDDLKLIPFLNDVQIYNLLNHISEYGGLITIYELQTVEGFNENTIENILPYVTVTSTIARRQVSFSEIMERSNHQLFVRSQRILQEQKGFSPVNDSTYAANPNSIYLGSPDRLYIRYRFTYYNNLSIGITGQKNPGEEFFKGTQKEGFDFYSAHFWMQDIGFLKTFAVGDYHLYFGQGLALWTGFSTCKSSDISSMKQNARGIRPYTSTDENRFLRGGAASYQIGNFEITGFFSHKKIDANLQISIDTLGKEDIYASSLPATGFHRTPSELDKKNALQETLFGSRVEFKTRGFNVGATAYKHAFEHPLGRRIVPYNQFEFNAQSLTITSADYNYVRRNMNFFGEIARSDNDGLAFTQGLFVTPAHNITVSFNYRNFQKNYHSLYSAAFSETTKIGNEQAFFTGIDLRLRPKWIFTGYADMFRFPWLKYRVDAPSHGHDMLGQITYHHSRKTHFYFRYQQKNKFLNQSTENIIDPIALTEKNNYRLHAHYTVSPSFVFKTRAEYTTYSVDNNLKNGFLIYQDFVCHPLESPWAVTLRYALFDTDSYDERIYAYENDVLYAFSIPSYYYRGSRAYLLIKYSLSRNIDLWVRYAQTFYNNRKTSGSGLDQIEGNLRSEIKAQVRFKF